MTLKIVRLTENAPIWNVASDDTKDTAPVFLRRSSGDTEYELEATGLTVKVAGIEKKHCAKIRRPTNGRLFYVEERSLIHCGARDKIERLNSNSDLFEKFGELNRQLQVQVAELCKAHGVEGQWVGTLRIERKVTSSEDSGV